MKKNNLLSALLILVMLVSMMGSFALPAMAEEAILDVVEGENSDGETPSEGDVETPSEPEEEPAEPEKPAATAISIVQGETYQEYVGHSVQFTVTFEPEDCVAEQYAWSSSASSVVSVDGTGTAIFRSAGTAIVEVCTESGLSDQIAITVDAQSIDPEDGITRAEWLSELVYTLGLIVEEEALPDNYFADVTEDHPYYYEILLATQFGVLNIEAGEKLYPDSALTRDFAVSTLNFCLGYQLTADAEYTFSDSAYCSDPASAQIAVNRGWLALTEEGEFAPAALVTEEEFSAMLAAGEETLIGQEIDPNYENTYTFSEGVVVLPQDLAVTEGDGTLTITDCPETIAVGDQFAVWFNGIPNVYTALSVTTDGADTVIGTQLVNDEGVLESVDAQGILDFGAMEIVPAEGVEIDVRQVSSGVGTYGMRPYATFYVPEVNASKTIKSGGLSLKYEVKIKDPRVKYSDVEGRKLYLLTGDLSVSASIKGDLIAGATGFDDDIPVFTCIVGGIGSFDVVLKPELSGKFTATFEGAMRAGLEYYTDDNTVRTISEFTQTNLYSQIDLSGSLGLEARFGITKLPIVEAYVFLDAGMKAAVSGKTYVDDLKPEQCVDFKAHLYAKYGYKVGAKKDGGKAGLSDDFPIFNESNSPVRVVKHYEDWAQVAKCTREIKNGKYQTTSDSKFADIGTDSNTILNPDGTTSSNYAYTVENGEATITDYLGTAQNVRIPAYIDGYPVTTIGGLSFAHNSLTSVIIPNSVTTIEDYAFYYCRNLTSVTIADSVTTIGNSAFEWCTSLSFIRIPDSVTTIGEDTFYNCYNLISVIIGNSVTTIGDSAFSLAGLSNVTIPDSVTTIGDYAFWNCRNLVSVTIGNGVTIIGDGAFSSCESLSSLTIPDSVTTIRNYTFQSCSSLTSVVIHDGVTFIGDYAFSSCEGLASVTMGDNVEAVGEGAFYGCTGLTDVYISDLSNWCEISFKPTSSWDYGNLYYYPYSNPLFYAKNLYLNGDLIKDLVISEDVTTIGGYAFYNAKWLTSVTIPANVKHIGANAFQYCSNLNSVYSTSVKEWCSITFENADSNPLFNAGNLYFSDELVTDLLIPSEFVRINEFAFVGCKSLNSVNIRENVRIIGQSAFKGCTNLNSINLPNSVYFIGTSAFEGCTVLNSITLPDGVTDVGDSAFLCCTDLASVTIGDNVKNVGERAFYGCTGLTDVYISNLSNWCEISFTPTSSWNYGNLYYYPYSNPLFYAKNLYLNGNLVKDLVIPEGVAKIGDYAFYQCNGISSVIIPDSVTAIGENAFYGSSGLETVIIYKNADLNVNSSAFSAETTVVYLSPLDKSKPHLTLDPTNINLANLNTVDFAVNRVYWGYAGAERIDTQNWNTFTAAVPSAIRVNDYNPTEGETYAMTQSGYYLFWIQYADATGATKNICHTVYAGGTLDENYGKPYLEFDKTGKVAWMNLNGTTVQKMYWGFIGDTDYKYSTWDEFCTRVRNNGSYLPDYGVKDGEGYVVNEAGYYRFVIVYFDAQGIRQERYYTIMAETPATAPSIDNTALSTSGVLVNEEQYTSKVYYGYIGETNTKYIDFNDFKATAEGFTTSFGPKPGTAFKMDKAGYWRFVINYTVNGATKDAIYTVYVDEADLALGTPRIAQRGNAVTLDANGSTVSKVYIGYMGTAPVEVDSWNDYTAYRQTNSVYYGPKDGTAFTLGEAAGYYTVVVSYNTGGAEQLAYFTYQI